MLNVILGKCDNCIYNTSMFFDNQYLDSWIEDDFARRILKAIDKGEPISNRAIDTKALGVIPVTKISGGAKTLLLVKNRPDKIFNVSTCGDNCSKFLLEIGKSKDVTVNLRHIMNFGNKNFEIKIINSGVIVRDMDEFARQAVLYV